MFSAVAYKALDFKLRLSDSTNELLEESSPSPLIYNNKNIK